MSFLTFPLLLAGLGAAAIPVVLHLIMRGVPRQYEFPALRFIQKKLRVNERKFKLKHLILLLLRVLLFALLGFALARPALIMNDGDGAPASSGSFASTFGKQRAPIAAVFVIDTSPRMGYTIENRTRLDAARIAAREIMDRLPPESKIGVIGGTRTGDGYQIDSLAASLKLEKMTVSPSERPIAESVLEGIRLLKESDLPDRELFIFTDLTMPGWPRELSGTIRNSLQTVANGTETSRSIGVSIIDTGMLSPDNSAIASLRLSNQVFSAQTKLRLELELSHVGKTENRSIELITLSRESSNESGGGVETVTEQKRGSQTVDFSEGRAMRNCVMELSGFTPGIHQGIVRFTSPDALTGDDTAAFTFEVQAPWKILIAAEEPIAKNSHYLRQALDPLELRKTGFAPFDASVVSIASLEAAKPDELLKYRAIFIVDPKAISAPNWRKLADFASSGHGVGVFLGRNPAALDSFRDPNALEVLGGKLLSQVGRPDGVQLAPEDFQNPVLSVFRTAGSNIQVPWDALIISRYWSITDLNESAYVAIPFSDGKPAVITRVLGQGVTLTMTTPISENVNDAGKAPWNMLPLADGSDASWVYVALCDGIGRFLVGAGEKTYNYTAGQTAVVRPGEDRLPDGCVMVLPNRETMRLSPDVVKRLISFSATDMIGNYRIQSGGESLTLDTGFSVNLKPGQTNLERIEKSQLDDAFGENKFQLIRDVKDYRPGTGSAKAITELFPILAVVLAVFFALEYAFANRFYGPAGNEQ